MKVSDIPYLAKFLSMLITVLKENNFFLSTGLSNWNLILTKLLNATIVDYNCDQFDCEFNFYVYSDNDEILSEELIFFGNKNTINIFQLTFNKYNQPTNLVIFLEKLGKYFPFCPFLVENKIVKDKGVRKKILEGIEAHGIATLQEIDEYLKTTSKKVPIYCIEIE